MFNCTVGCDCGSGVARGKRYHDSDFQVGFPACIVGMSAKIACDFAVVFAMNLPLAGRGTPLVLLRGNLVEAGLASFAGWTMALNSHPQSFACSTFHVTCLLVGCALLSGCPWTTRYPNLQVEHPEASRQLSQTQDPFPDSHLGPQVDARPPGFSQQRSEAQIAKSRSYASWLRIQAQPPQVMPPNPAIPNGYVPRNSVVPAAVYPVQPYPAMAYPPPPGMYPLGVPYPVPYYAAPAPVVR